LTPIGSARIVLINGAPGLRRVAPSQLPLTGRPTMHVTRRANHNHTVFRHRTPTKCVCAVGSELLGSMRGRGASMNGGMQSPMVIGHSSSRGGVVVQRGGGRQSARGARGAARVTNRQGTSCVDQAVKVRLIDFD